MNKFLEKFVILCAIFIPSSLVWAESVLVTLSPDEQVVSQGQAPRFVVNAKAIGKPLRIMKFSIRGDLKDNYAQIRVRKNGRDVDVPIGISDPGPTSDSDYEVLGVGRSIAFEHRGEPFSLDRLLPGEYEATLIFRSDWNTKAVNSNQVTFRVIPK